MHGVISGHAPGHIREEFQDLLEKLYHGDIEYTDPEVLRLTGKLWCCTDTLPGADCMLADAPSGSSYAMVARSIRRYAKAQIAA
jgi:hypothetical protein